MKDGATVDFTTTIKPLGSRHRMGSGKMAICPKCDRTGDRTWRGWCWAVDDYCTVRVEPTEDSTRERAGGQSDE